MSPRSRGRKGRNKKSTARSATPQLLEIPDDLLDIEIECHCPACSGEDVDHQQLADELVADLAESEDPLTAELAAAELVATGELVGQDLAGQGFPSQSLVGQRLAEVLVDTFIPEFETRADTGAQAILLALGAVAEGRAAEAASAAAGRLTAAGVARPRWADELDEPVTVGGAWRIVDPKHTASMFFCSFHRAGRSHAAIINVNHLNCGAADSILLLDAEQLPQAMEMVRAGTQGVEMVEQPLEPAELRWHLESALDARAVHDEVPWQLGDISHISDVDMDDLIDYRIMAALMRARIRALPAPSKPTASHGVEAHRALPTAQDVLARLAGNAASLPLGALPSAGRRGRAAPDALPPKRKKSAGSAPVYQIKVGLRDASPPIWRRLEVLADINLRRLHEIIQIAFGWYDCHLHAFQTPYGDFGTGESESERPEKSVTLEQVAPGARSTIRYTYDFGDDWEHDILVEKVLDRDKAVSYPRCTGGRRAAPPEDCGGIWGYAELQQALTDPKHPDHEDILEWLGLDDPDEFNPDDFDAAKVSMALSKLS